MPEQEKIPQAAAEQSLPGPEQLGESMQQEANGAAEISPLLIIPPVIIAAVMALALALVYGVTKEPIAEAKRKELNDKLAMVMPDFDNDPGTTVQDLGNDVKLYTGRTAEEVSGFALACEGAGSYSGGFYVIFGLLPDGTINKVRILETKETPGLGTKADPFIIDQMEGQTWPEGGFKVVKDGGDIDAISGATITSRAVCSGVNLGIETFNAAGGAEAAQTPDVEAQIEEMVEEIESGEEPEAVPSAAGEEESSDGN